jgi:hypothetical protein
LIAVLAELSWLLPFETLLERSLRFEAALRTEIAPEVVPEIVPETALPKQLRVLPDEPELPQLFPDLSALFLPDRFLSSVPASFLVLPRSFYLLSGFTIRTIWVIRVSGRRIWVGPVQTLPINVKTPLELLNLLFYCCNQI